MSDLLPADLAQVVEHKMKTLRTFTSKHRPTLCQCGVRALDLGRNPQNAEIKFLRIHVRQRPDPQPAHLLYVVEDAEVVAYDDLPPSQAAEMKGVLKESKRTGAANMAESFFVMLHDAVTQLCNVAPVSFAKEATYPEPIPYKEYLMEHLNNGIIY